MAYYISEKCFTRQRLCWRSYCRSTRETIVLYDFVYIIQRGDRFAYYQYRATIDSAHPRFASQIVSVIIY